MTYRIFQIDLFVIHITWKLHVLEIRATFWLHWITLSWYMQTNILFILSLCLALSRSLSLFLSRSRPPLIKPRIHQVSHNTDCITDDKLKYFCNPDTIHYSPGGFTWERKKGYEMNNFLLFMPASLGGPTDFSPCVLVPWQLTWLNWLHW